MLCATCMFFMAKRPSVTDSDPLAQSDSGLGRCRKHSPSLDGWPAVFETDWCGDHKIDENKIA